MTTEGKVFLLVLAVGLMLLTFGIGVTTGEDMAYEARCEAAGGTLEEGALCTDGDSILWRTDS